ncbi:MAG: ribosome recycling factor [Legionellales bacterium RIFCSPHIGHO2_12_FULL_35_11]|nr:MAG: ribosome recycling factor [Legionellales bacterium RIFCSPHIGHO2_12_FULL_35_11]
MFETIKREAEQKMRKAVDALHHEMTKIRTGRANASLLDHVQVEYYGNLTPLNQVASVSASDSRTILVTPFDKTMVADIERAIMNSDLGLNPSSAGTAIRVPMPALTEDRRRELIKVVRAEAEQGRVSVRNIRRDANNKLKEEKTISEDDERRGNEVIQKLTDKHILEIDELLAHKEKDLLDI